MVTDGPGCCFSEARSFNQGQYTLAYPNAINARDFSFLDASLSVIAAPDRSAWIKSKCGYSCFTDGSDMGPLHVVDPCANWFCLCLCDPGVIPYVKRLSSAVRSSMFVLRVYNRSLKALNFNNSYI